MLSFQLLESALAVSAASVTLTKSELTRPIRERWLVRSPTLTKLFSCPYCISHWLAGVAALFLAPRDLWVYGVDVFALVSLATIVTGLCSTLLHWQHNEILGLRAELELLREELEDERVGRKLDR